MKRTWDLDLAVNLELAYNARDDYLSNAPS